MAKGPISTPAGVDDATIPSPPVAANRVDTADAWQSRDQTVVDKPGGAEVTPALAARPKDRPVPSPLVTADRVDTANARQSRVNPHARARLVATDVDPRAQIRSGEVVCVGGEWPVVDEPGRGESAPTLAARPKD